MSSYGYIPYYKPIAKRNTSGLATAAGSKDPYGLAPNNRSGPLGIGSSSGFAAPRSKPKPAPRPVSPISANDPRIAASNAANPHAAGANGSLFAGSMPAAPTAASVNKYDLNTDPALQQIQSLVGMSNEQAQSSALKQRQDLLLAYGDPAVAGSVLGSDDPIAAAAGRNPNSTVAQLGQSRDRNLKQLIESLNGQNLGYSGYRVTQEQQAGQDYQNALAQAAAGLNQNLGGIDSNLASVLAGNNGQLVAGINDAADRAAAAAAASGVDPGASDPAAGVDPTDPAAEATALAAAAAGGGGGSGTGGDGGAASGASYTTPQVGTTNSDWLYQLLGRKTDPRFG